MTEKKFFSSHKVCVCVSFVFCFPSLCLLPYKMWQWRPMALYFFTHFFPSLLLNWGKFHTMENYTQLITHAYHPSYYCHFTFPLIFHFTASSCHCLVLKILDFSPSMSSFKIPKFVSLCEEIEQKKIIGKNLFNGWDLIKAPHVLK